MLASTLCGRLTSLVLTSADFLLIDLGNTSAKLRRANTSELLGKTRRLPMSTLLTSGGADALRETLGDWRFGRVVLSSVVPTAAQVVTATWPDALTIHARLDTGVDLRGYPGARTLGADRLANLAGYLPARTALLPPVRFTGAIPRAIGRHTTGAIRAGTILGYRGLVGEIIAGLRAELGADARVVATGGDARFLAARTGTLLDRVDPDLTLHGLRVIATLNSPPRPA